MNSYFYERNTINPNNDFRRLRIDNPFDSFNQSDFSMSNYSNYNNNIFTNTFTNTQPKTQRFDDFVIDKKIRDLKTNIKPLPLKNIYSNANFLADRKEMKYEPFNFQNNNTQRIDDIKDIMNNFFIENRGSKFYSTKTNPVPKSNFLYSINTHNFTKSGIQSPSIINNEAPKSSRIQTELNYNNDTLLNKYQYENYDKNNYSNQAGLNYDIKPDNNQIMNNIQKSDNFQLINNNNDFNIKPDKGQIMNNIQDYNNIQSLNNINNMNVNYNLSPQLLSKSTYNNQYSNNYININNLYSENNSKIHDIQNEFINNNNFNNIHNNINELNNNNINNQNQKSVEEKNFEYLTSSPQIKTNQRNNINPQFAKSAYFPKTTLQLNNEAVSRNNFYNNNIQTKNANFIESKNLNFNFDSPKKNISNLPNVPAMANEQITNDKIDSNNLSNGDTRKSESKEEKEEKDEKIRASMSNFHMENGEIISNSDAKEYYRESNNGLVKSYAYFQDQNVGNREYMEDQGKVVENLEGDPNKILFCLFDGHGGGQVSKFLQENFHKYLKNYLPFKNYFRGFYNLFKFLDEEIKLLNVPQTGSTATIVFIEKKDGKKFLYCVNAGDSRCVLVSKKRIMRMSYDDRVEDPKEKKRILQQGGIIYSGRIYGSLMLSRSFGDWLIKSYGVIVDPHITKIELTDDDLYLIIASDGLWDAIKDEECRRLCETNNNTMEICKNFVVESLKRGSQDNISCFIISFK